MDFRKVINVFVDSNDPSYDVAIPIHCNQRTLASENNEKQVLNTLQVTILSFENGKVTKMIAENSISSKGDVIGSGTSDEITANIRTKTRIE